MSSFLIEATTVLFVRLGGSRRGQGLTRLGLVGDL
jgi:hypothetical protein